MRNLLNHLKLKLSRNHAIREEIASSEYPASGFLPYMGYWNDFTVINKDNTLMQFVKVSGFSFETADDEDLDIKKELRNMLFKGLAGANVGLYFHIVRREQPAYPSDYASVDMPDGFALYLDNKWVERHKNRKSYVNELYVSISKKPASSGVLSGVEDIVKKVVQGTDKEAWQATMQETFEELEEATGRIMNSLRAYSPELLGIVETKDGIFSEISEFLGSIVNCGERSRYRISKQPISKQLCNNRLYFGRKAMEMKKQDGSSKYAGIISIKEYGPKTWAGILDSFLQMPFEFIISQSFEFIDRQLAIGAMQLQQNRMIQAGDKAISQIDEINTALDKAMSGEIGFGKHHLTVMCMCPDPKELEQVLSIASVELSNSGCISVREKVNMEPAFWGQLPGNFDFLVRKATINTANLSAFNSLHNFPVGKERNNHWGDAVTALDTTSGTPFYFNFHVRDVGHTVIIGPTGSGKTVLMNFLCAQAQKFKCRLFFFDKDRGAEIFIRALGGQYTIIDPGKKCGFNPLQLPDTGENRVFLSDWLKLLVTTNNEPLNSDDIAIINTAINGNYKLDQKDRKLSSIAPFFGIGGPGTLAGRLAMWYGNGSHASVFDNDDDVIDFNKSSVFGFEMAELLRDLSTLGPVLSYIFHRINISLDGTPTMIVLDEAWALIDNPIFAPKIKDWLKVLRKLNTFVVFATQSVEDASKSAISDTLIQQTATQIFLPNLKATEVYRTTFMLSEREFQLIKNTDPSSRYFLVKQSNDSVIARVDLSAMVDVVNVLSGRASTVGILDEVRAQHGEDPNIWIPIFNQRVKELSEE
jgi:type IV secretion system protein VirB4